MEPQPSPDSTDTNRIRPDSGVAPHRHAEQPLAPLSLPNPREWHLVTQTTNPLDELKKFARELNTQYFHLGDSTVKANHHFGSLHITVEADLSRPSYPEFVTLNKIPNLHGIDPYRIIFPDDPYLDERGHFFAAITLSLPNRLTSSSNAVPAGVKAGLAEAGERPSIPSDQAVMVWLEYDGARDCYTVQRPNTRGLGDYSVFRFDNLEPQQKLLDDRWAWNALERALQSVLPDGLIAEDRHHGGLREILNDSIDIRSASSSHPLPRPYEMTAYLLDAIAEVNVTRGGFLWSKEISRPARPLVTEIAKQAEQFATIHHTRETYATLKKLKEQGNNLLGIEIKWSTAACLGELVIRLEKEMTRRTPLSYLAQDLRKILGWHPNQSQGPECVRDFLTAVGEIRSTAEIGGCVTAAQCREALEGLDRGLRALGAAGQENRN